MILTTAHLWGRIWNGGHQSCGLGSCTCGGYIWYLLLVLLMLDCSSWMLVLLYRLLLMVLIASELLLLVRVNHRCTKLLLVHLLMLLIVHYSVNLVAWSSSSCHRCLWNNDTWLCRCIKDILLFSPLLRWWRSSCCSAQEAICWSLTEQVKVWKVVAIFWVLL